MGCPSTDQGIRGHGGDSTQSSRAVSSLYFMVCLDRFQEWPLPCLEVVLQVLEAERREIGADPLACPPLALSGMLAPREAEPVPVVLSSDPPVRDSASAWSPWLPRHHPPTQPVVVGPVLLMGKLAPPTCAWGLC
jgi:hypothetical protein